MQRSLTYALAAVLLAWTAAQAGAQSAPAPGQAAPTLAPGSVIGAELAKGVDAKKAKVGQPVIAKSLADLRNTNGDLVLPRGAKLLGHVTEVKPATKQEPQSSLGIIFDKVESKHGKQSQEIGMRAAIQALAKPQPSPMMQEEAPGPSGGPGGPSGGGGTMGAGRPGMGPGGAGGQGPGGASPGQSGEMGGPPMGQQGRGGAPPITANSHGVIGIPNLTLNPQPSPTEGSILTSSRGNVKLDSGTLMVLRVIGQ